MSKLTTDDFLNILPRGFVINDELENTLSYIKNGLRFHLMLEWLKGKLTVYSMNSVERNFDMIYDFDNDEIDYTGFIISYNKHINDFASKFKNDDNQDYIRQLMIKDEIKIKFIRQNTWFSDIGDTEIYFFYPNGIWDDDKLILSEALVNYPKDKYDWIEIIDYDVIDFFFSDIAKEKAYRFYPFDKWDGELLSESEALQKYPKDKYEWNLIDDEM